MRLRAKVDDNQKEIVAAARKLGCSVAITSQLGKGFPDLVIGLNGVNYLVEVKDSKKPPSARKLTDDEKKFKAAWYGQYDVIESIDDLLLLLLLK